MLPFIWVSTNAFWPDSSSVPSSEVYVSAQNSDCYQLSGRINSSQHIEGSNCEKTHPPTNNCRPFSGHTDILWHVGISIASVSRFSRLHGVTAGREGQVRRRAEFIFTFTFTTLSLSLPSYHVTFLRAGQGYKQGCKKLQDAEQH